MTSDSHPIGPKQKEERILFLPSHPLGFHVYWKISHVLRNPKHMNCAVHFEKLENVVYREKKRVIYHVWSRVHNELGEHNTSTFETCKCGVCNNPMSTHGHGQKKSKIRSVFYCNLMASWGGCFCALVCVWSSGSCRSNQPKILTNFFNHKEIFLNLEILRPTFFLNLARKSKLIN